MTSLSALRLDGVTHRYGDLDMRFDLEVVTGEWLAVIGPSGAGKSTLLDLAAGFLTPDEGRVTIAGADVTRTLPGERALSFVFQENNLFPHLDAFGNVALGVTSKRRLSVEERRKVMEALDRVGLSGLEHRRPGEMSGGERQRVALARAVLRDRPLLLLDEPFAALGPALRREMLGLLAGLARDRPQPMSIVMVTHQPDDTRGFADRVAFLAEGRIRATGPTAEILSGRHHPEIAEYLGSSEREGDQHA